MRFHCRCIVDFYALNFFSYWIADHFICKNWQRNYESFWCMQKNLSIFYRYYSSIEEKSTKYGWGNCFFRDKCTTIQNRKRLFRFLPNQIIVCLLACLQWNWYCALYSYTTSIIINIEIKLLHLQNLIKFWGHSDGSIYFIIVSFKTPSRVAIERIKMIFS